MFTLWGCLDYAIWFLPSALLLSRSLRYSVVTFHLRNIDKQIPNPSQGGCIVLHASRCLSPMSATSSSFHRVFLHKSLPCRSTFDFPSSLSYCLTRFFHKHDRRSDCHVGSNSNLRSLVPTTGRFLQHLTLNLNFFKVENQGNFHRSDV